MKRSGRLVLLVAAVMFPFMAQTAGATLVAPPGGLQINPVTGYPSTYADSPGGVILGLCTDPAYCVVPVGDPALDGYEGFYWLAEADFTSFPLVKVFRMALEQATLPPGPGLPVERTVFTRLIVTFNGAPAGAYLIEHPFGQFTCNWAGANGDCKFDFPANPVTFNDVLGTPNTLPNQFLSWTPPLPAPNAAGVTFLGQFATPHTITPGPGGAIARITPPAGVNLGAGAGFAIQASLWNLMAQVQGDVPPQIFSVVPPDPTMSMNRLSTPVKKVFNYFDPNGGALTAAITGTPLPAFCNAVDNGAALTVTCTPTLGSQQGTTDNVTVTVTDNTARTVNSTPFAITVNNLAPTIAAPAPLAKPFNEPTLTTMAITATDPDGNTPITLTGQLQGPPHVWFAFNPATGIEINGTQLTPGDLGNYTVNVTAQDNGTPVATSTAVVQFAIVGTNTAAPVIAEPGTFTKFFNDPTTSRVPITATDADNNIIVMTATMTPSRPWFSFDNAAKQVVIDGSKVTSGDLGSYTVTLNATDVGIPPLSATAKSLTVTIAAPPQIVIDQPGGGGGGGCSMVGSRGDWKDGVGSYGALLLVGLSLAIRRRLGRKGR